VNEATLALAALSPIRPGAGAPGRCRVFGKSPEDDEAGGVAVATALATLTEEVKGARADTLKVGTDYTETKKRLDAIEAALEQRKKDIDAFIAKNSAPKVALPGYDPTGGGDPKKAFSLRRAMLLQCVDASGRSKITGEDTTKFIEREVIAEYAIQQKTQTGTVAADGGFLVGVQLMPDFIPLLRAQAVATRAGVRLMTGATGNDIIFNKELTAIPVTRDGEVATITPSGLTFGDITLRRKRASALCYISRSLLSQTSGSIQNIVEQSMAKSAANRFDLDYFTGAGSANIPLGVKNTAGLLTVDFNSPAIDYLGADQNVTDKLDALVYKLKTNDSYLGRPTFFAHPQGGQALRSTKDANGRPILWTPTDLNGNDASQGGAASVAITGQPGRLWGHNYFETTQLAGTGANGDLLLINVDDSIQVIWDAIEIAGSEHFSFDTNRLAVRLIAFEDSALFRGISAVSAINWTIP
jgi:HK97 family phage major capsid protein